MEYRIEIEETPTGFSAYSPDLPGVGAAAETREDVERLLAEAIEFHLACLNVPTLTISSIVTVGIDVKDASRVLSGQPGAGIQGNYQVAASGSLVQVGAKS